MCGFGIGTIFQVAIFVIVVLVVLALLRILLGDFFTSLTGDYWNVIRIVIGGVVAIVILMILWRLAECAGVVGRVGMLEFGMSDYSDFVGILKDHANREDWSDDLVGFFISQANQKFNAELRVSRMIQSDDALIASRCAPLPDDWLEISLVRIACDNVPDGFLPIRYKARDEFFNTPDKWAANFYTIEGRQIYIGGMPDAVNGTTVRITYYGEVPAFSGTVDSWIYTKYPNLYLSAAMMHAYMHAVGEEQQAALAKQLAEDEISKLNDEWRMAKASGSRLTRTRTRSFG